MAGITLAQAQAQLDAALAALSAASTVKEVQVTGSVGGRKTVFQELQPLRDNVQYWDTLVRRLSRGGSGPTFALAVPCG